MSRSEAEPHHFCIRRVPPWSAYWADPDKVSSANYNDAELSVDLWPTDPVTDIAEIIKKCLKEKKDKGFGATFCMVSGVNKVLAEKSINGCVLKDPLSDNELHGLITGDKSNSKKNTLKRAFLMLVKPEIIDT